MPEDSFIRFEDAAQRREWLPILEGIYEWESNRVAGPWAGRAKSDIRNCTWTRAQMVNFLHKRIDNFSESSFDGLIDHLIAERHILRIEKPEPRFKSKGGKKEKYPRVGDVYITRMAEIVRTAGAIHDFPSRKRDIGSEANFHPQLIEGTKWVPRIRMNPKRTIAKGAIIERVLSAFDSNRDYRLPNGSTLADAIADLQLVLDVLDSEFGGKLKFSKFQSDAIYAAFLNSWSKNPPKKGIIITANTGAGKTLGFLIPAIVDSLIENRMAAAMQDNGGVSQLLLYPRNDLAKDQKSNLDKIISRLNDVLIDEGRSEDVITTAIDAGGLIRLYEEYIPSNKKMEQRMKWNACEIKGTDPDWKLNVYDSSMQKYAGEGGTITRPANIMIAGIESFRKRLGNEFVAKALRENLKRVVLDEIHLSSGVEGAHHSFMIRRLRQICFSGHNRLTFMGASATISHPREHAARIWKLWPNEIHHIDSADESEEDLVPTGIMNHILVRPKKGAATTGALTDLTSLIGHQRRTRDMHNRPKLFKSLQKSIGFADSHDVIGNWFQLMRENEMTDKRSAVDDPESYDQTFPYSHWYSRPLEVHEGGKEVCDSCQEMKKTPNPITISHDTATLIKRRPDEDLGSAKRFDMRAFTEQGTDGEIKVSGLDTCPYLQAGTCWWFAPRTGEDSKDLLEGRPGKNSNKYSYKKVLRVKKHTSKSKSSDSDYNESADHTFKEDPHWGAYPGNWDKENPSSKIKHDLVVATPTLEVGIDMSNVTEVFTHKAIRNISSYRQKIGRGGREEGTDSVAATLMSLTNSDFLHYRSPGRLIDSILREPIPIAERNREIMRSEAYMSIFDWLALKNYRIEKVIKSKPGDSNWGAWGNLINKAIEGIGANENDVIQHMHYSTHELLEREDLISALSSVRMHLNALLEKYPCKQDENMRIADYVTWRNNRGIGWGRGHGPEKVANNVKPQLKKLQTQLGLLSDDVSTVDDEEPGFKSEFPIIEKLQELAKSESVDEITDTLDEVRDAVSTAKKFYDEDDSDSETRDDKKDVWNALESIEKKIIKLKKKSSGETYHKLVKQIKNLKAPIGTSYLSSLLVGCTFFQENCPYVMIGTSFVNPYENKIQLVKTGKNYSRSESITIKDALKYYLPGMWTFRAFYGEPLRVKSGYLQGGDPPQWVEHYDSDADTSPDVDAVGKLEESKLKSIPLPLRAGLDDEGSSPIKLNLKQIYVEQEWGAQGSLQKVQMTDEGLVVGFDAPESGGYLKSYNRPKAYSTTWDLVSKEQNLTEVKSHELREMNEEKSNLTFSVLRHPLIANMFSGVDWGDFMITRVATCVSRDNSVRIRFQFNQEPAVYINDFSTEGIRFTVSSEISKKSRSLFKNWRKLPFDTLALRAFRVVLEKGAGTDWSQRYAINSYIECMVQLAYITDYGDNCPENKFPNNFGEFVDLVLSTPMPDHIIADRARYGVGGKQKELILEDLNRIGTILSLNVDNIRQSIDDTLVQWAKETYCNTLALILKETASEYSGVPSDKISYSFNTDPDGHWKICLYDEDANGNGSMQVIREHFQIPIEVRDANQHFDLGSLPTSDFVSELERRMTICSEHVAQTIAIEEIDDSSLVPKDLRDQSEQLSDDYKLNSWDVCGAQNVREAALHNLRRFFILEGDEDDQYTLDFHNQGLELCDSGCSACNGDDTQNAFRGPLLESYTCRSLVDLLVSLGPETRGYLLKNQNEIELASLAGTPIEPELVLDFIPDDGGNGVAKRLTNWGDTPPIGLHWIRGGDNTNPDWLVRYREAV